MSTNFWTKRVVDFGHTGWADEAIYAFDQPIRIEIVDYLIKRFSKGGVLLDFGCGNGEFSSHEKKRFNKIVLYDTCKEVLSIASQLNSGAKCISNFNDLLEEKEKFDTILSITVLQHILEDTELDQVISFMSKKLADGGCIIVMEQFHSRKSEYIRSWNVEDLQNIFERNGLKCVCSYNFYENGIYKDPIFKKYYSRIDIYIFSHLYKWIPQFRKIFRRILNFSAKKGKYYSDIKRFLFMFDNREGDKFLVFQKMKTEE